MLVVEPASEVRVHFIEKFLKGVDFIVFHVFNCWQKNPSKWIPIIIWNYFRFTINLFLSKPNAQRWGLFIKITVISNINHSSTSFLLAQESHQLQFSFPEELQPVLQVFVENFDFLVLVVLDGGRVGLQGLAWLDFKYLVFDFCYFAANHLIFGHKVAVDVFLVEILLCCWIFNEQLLQVLELYLQSVVVVVYYHIVLLSYFSGVSQLLVLVLQTSHLELVLLHDLVQGYFDLIFLELTVRLSLLFLLRSWNTQRLARSFFCSLVQRRELLLLWLIFGYIDFALWYLFNLLPQIQILESQKIPFSCKSIDNLIFFFHLNHWFVFDVHRSGCIIEGTQGFV